MAWRLDKSVIKGEIDNREQGRVSGRLWLLNRPEPVLLSLEGNCHRDMAGCLLAFENPQPDEGDHTHLHPRQDGIVGDMTAARKVRVLDMPVEEAYLAKKAGKEVPEHMGNCLYLEWFSDFNGRVVIESVDYKVEISERAWTMSEEEELEQLKANQDAMGTWMERLSGALERQREEKYDPEADKPMDEFAWERFMKDSDERTDKLGEIMEKYMDHPDRDRLVAREMGWTWLEEALDADEKGVFDEEKKAKEREEVPELVPDPLTEGTDWVRDEKGDVVHPLQRQAFNVAMDMWHDAKALGLVGIEGQFNEDVHNMTFQAQTLGAKLAGALNGLAYDDDPDGGFVVACLKRAMTYLNDAVAASETVGERGLIEGPRLDAFRKDLFEIREGMLQLMERFRG